MKMLVIVGVSGLLCMLPDLAQSATSEGCHQFTEDKARLNCYDTASSYNIEDEVSPETDPFSQAVEKPAAPKNQTKWVSRAETSPLDDTINVYLRIESDEHIRGRSGSSGPMTMHVQCRENTTMFYVHFNGLFMSDHRHGTVTYRLDDKPAQKRRFQESNNNKALGLWNGGSSIPFIKQMLGHKKMLVQGTPHSESAVMATFTIEGLEQEVEQLRKSCNW